MNSRAKGSRGELEAARVLTECTGVEWRRTAQRWGKAKADLEPVQGDSALHVEVKVRGHRLTHWERRAKKQVLSITNDGMLFCLLLNLHRVREQTLLPERAPQCKAVEGFMEQAIRDADEGKIPVVVCKQDHGPWLIAWRNQDDDRFCEAVRGAA